jgi:RNA polymerase sigma-70 factor (ECF subfamily)
VGSDADVGSMASTNAAYCARPALILSYPCRSCARATIRELGQAVNLAAGDDIDTALMVRAATGDLAAFEQLVRRNQAVAWGLAWRFLGDAAEAQDIVQEAFLKIYKAASRYQPSAKFRTYLYRVVTRLCLDWKSKKRPEYVEVLPSVPDSSRDPEVLVAAGQLSGAVQKCLADLPANQRLAMTLRQYDGMTYDEIAEILQVSPKAVDSLLQRARAALRRCLAVYRQGAGDAR